MLLAARQSEVVREWRRRVRAGWGDGPHWHTIDGADALVQQVVDEPGEASAAFRELGRRCGADGHTLDDVVGWTTELLAACPRRVRRRLDQRDLAVVLTAGWADGSFARPESRRVAAPVASLHLRLREHYDHCHALGVDPSTLVAVVVLDADTGPQGPVTRDAVSEVLADAARGAFGRGETIAVTPTGRILVLADRTAGLASVVRCVVDAVQHDPAVTGCRVQGWVEPIARDRRHLDAHLADLWR
jgi:hypothetical protein